MTQELPHYSAKQVTVEYLKSLDDKHATKNAGLVFTTIALIATFSSFDAHTGTPELCASIDLFLWLMSDGFLVHYRQLAKRSELALRLVEEAKQLVTVSLPRVDYTELSGATFVKNTDIMMNEAEVEEVLAKNLYPRRASILNKIKELLRSSI